jgi:hypothetical protein
VCLPPPFTHTFYASNKFEIKCTYVCGVCLGNGASSRKSTCFVLAHKRNTVPRGRVGRTTASAHDGT